MPFEFTNQNDYLVVTLVGTMNGDAKPPFSEQTKSKMAELGSKFLVIQCGDCGEMGIPFLRDLAQLHNLLKAENKLFRLVNANTGIQDSIKKLGLNRLLVCKMSLRGALVDFGLVKQKEIDTNFINPFLESTAKVMKIQAFMDAKPAKPFVKKAGDPMLLGDISGIIGIVSESFNGSLAISFPEAVFLKVASNMLGTEYKELSDDIVNLVGELSNIILGQAKLQLASLGYGIQQALPSCVWGKDHKIKTFGGGACIVMPFETASGTFYVEVTSNSAVQEQKKAA